VKKKKETVLNVTETELINHNVFVQKKPLTTVLETVQIVTKNVLLVKKDQITVPNVPKEELTLQNVESQNQLLNLLLLKMYQWLLPELSNVTVIVKPVNSIQTIV